MLEKIISEVETSIGFKETIRPIANELLLTIFDPRSGGLPSFAEKIKVVSGREFGTYIESLNSPEIHGSAARIPEGDTIKILGPETIGKIASSCNRDKASVITTASALLPKLLHVIAPSGKLPSGIPPLVTNYFPLLKTLALLPKNAEESGIPSVTLPPENFIAAAPMNYTSWALPLIVLAVLAWVGWSWINNNSSTVALKLPEASKESQQLGNLADQDSARAALAPQAIQPAPRPADPSTRILGDNNIKSIPAALVIKNVAGKIILSGKVPDKPSKDAIISALADNFEPNDISGELTIDERATTPLWIERLAAVLPELKLPGLTLSMLGDSVKLSGIALSKETLNMQMSRIKSAIGPGFSIAAELNQEETSTEDSKKS